ncbi:pseudouridine synthase [Kiritimatiellota bacterium B12222]|nr:pseudouridine synthase [Kiritimatiellota bacterium B12222]
MTVPSVYGKLNLKRESSIRLNRYLASCGLGSRRACDRLIADGDVTVDGKPVTSMGVTVFPYETVVKVYGNEVRPQSTRVLLVHKPRNVICTVTDPEDRKTVLDLLPDTWKDLRLYPVGRLDQNSEGLILVTNDGELSNRLTHPRYHVEKEYLVWLRDELTEEQGQAMLDGVKDEGERLAALAITPVPSQGRFYCYSMILGEGRNRHIRRMCDYVDAAVVRIKRIRMAGLDIIDLPVGECRELAGRELANVRKAVGLS